MGAVLEAIKNRYSTRGYKETQLTEEQINALVHAGLQAPTAANRQELHFSVVKKGNEALNRLDQELGGAKSFYYDAPVVIFISADEKMTWGPLDAGIAVQTIALAAEDLGLGSLIIGCVKGIFDSESGASYSKAFGFPEGYRYQVAVAVGEKAAAKDPHTYNYDKDVTIL